MFLAALFTVAKTRKQPKRPLTDEWNGILLSHKKSEVMPSAPTWMDSEITLSEVRERPMSHDNTYMPSHGILQAGIPERVAMPSCRGSPRPRD